MAEPFFNTVIIQTHAGIPFFELVRGKSGVDSVLISGMSMAISNVWTHMTEGDEEGVEIMERREQGICITAHRTGRTVMILVSKKRPTDGMISRIKFVHEVIEEKYADIIEANIQGANIHLPDDEILQLIKIHSIPV